MPPLFQLTRVDVLLPLGDDAAAQEVQATVEPASPAAEVPHFEMTAFALPPQHGQPGAAVAGQAASEGSGPADAEPTLDPGAGVSPDVGCRRGVTSGRRSGGGAGTRRGGAAGAGSTTGGGGAAAGGIAGGAIVGKVSTMPG